MSLSRNAFVWSWVISIQRQPKLHTLRQWQRWSAGMAICSPLLGQTLVTKWSCSPLTNFDMSSLKIVHGMLSPKKNQHFGFNGKLPMAFASKCSMNRLASTRDRREPIAMPLVCSYISPLKLKKVEWRRILTRYNQLKVSIVWQGNWLGHIWRN